MRLCLQKRENSVINFDSYYAIDIGGWTIDVITFIKDTLDNLKCDSKTIGVLPMYESIIKHAEEETGKRITNDIIESILTGKPTLVRRMLKNLFSMMLKTVRLILGGLVQFGLSFDLYPTLFIGGAPSFSQIY